MCFHIATSVVMFPKWSLPGLRWTISSHGGFRFAMGVPLNHHPAIERWDFPVHKHHPAFLGTTMASWKPPYLPSTVKNLLRDRRWFLGDLLCHRKNQTPSIHAQVDGLCSIRIFSKTGLVLAFKALLGGRMGVTFAVNGGMYKTYVYIYIYMYIYTCSIYIYIVYIYKYIRILYTQWHGNICTHVCVYR